MLYVSLVQSAVLVALAIRAARPSPHPVRWKLLLVWGGVVAFVPCWLVAFPATMWTYFALAAALAGWSVVRHRYPRAVFGPVAGVVAVAANLGAVYTLSPDVDRLRAAHPVESMADRVPAPPARGARPAADPALESALETASHRTLRVAALGRLHGSTTDLFVNSPAFGAGRMARFWAHPSDRSLMYWPRDPAPTQPGPDVSPMVGPAEPPPREMHTAGVVDFVNPGGFGYVRDRRHAAGFQPHGFTRVPGPTVRYQVERVELVGLLLHPGPVVYVSDKLPEMTAVRTTPTRPLDDFESAALAELHAGKELIEKDDRTPARLLGSLRNGKQCVACHGGERGDLLGAFSYTLRVR